MDGFRDRLNDPDPGFVCAAIGASPEQPPKTFRVWNRADPPASIELIHRIPADVPGANAVRDFYTAHNGGRLFVRPHSEPDGSRVGVELHPLEEWDQRTEQIVPDFDDVPEDCMPYGREDFISIAYPCGASNYIHWVVRGPEAGRVYWWAWTMPPEKGYCTPLAETFAAFLDFVCGDPVRFLNDAVGGYTIFETEGSLLRWKPARYLPDVRKRNA